MKEEIVAYRIGETLIDVIDEETEMPDCPKCEEELTIKTPEMQQLEDNEYYCNNCQEIKEVLEQ